MVGELVPTSMRFPRMVALEEVIVVGVSVTTEGAPVGILVVKATSANPTRKPPWLLMI